MAKAIVVALAIVAVALSAPLDQPGPAPQCPYPSEDITWFPNPYNCSQYYECYEGNLFIMECGFGLYWNEETLSCDYRVDCRAILTSTTTTTTTTTTTPATTTEESTTELTTTVTTLPPSPDELCAYLGDGAYIANPDDCSRYFECINGAPVPGQCPVGSLWNEDVINCDFPQNVHCEL